MNDALGNRTNCLNPGSITLGLEKYALGPNSAFGKCFLFVFLPQKECPTVHVSP